MSLQSHLSVLYVLSMISSHVTLQIYCHKNGVERFSKEIWGVPGSKATKHLNGSMTPCH